LVHPRHALAPAAENTPAAHARQAVEAFPGAYVPFAQGRHVALAPAPLAFEAVPGQQASQADAGASE
jgi:hypothetical protein